MLISSFNYTNLTNANLSTRLKEIAVCKTNGANNRQIAFQFILESLIFWITGFGLALMIYKWSEGPLLQYLGMEVFITERKFKLLVFAIFIVLLIFNLLTNVLPILHFSRKKTMSMMHNEESTRKRFLVKDYFVTLQFALSAIIILSSVFVQKQIHFLMNKDRGYDTENVITLSMWSIKPDVRETFIAEIQKHSAIQSIATSDVYFGDDPSMNSAFFETLDGENYFHTSILPVDDQFLSTFNLHLVEGRFFDEERQSDFSSALLNETAVKEYKKNGSLLGKQLYIDGRYYEIIGIVKDFNFRSLYHEIQPLVLTRIENYGNIFVKVSGGQITEALEVIRSVRNELEISTPFGYQFHRDVISDHYQKDQKAKKLLLFLSVISVIIACVGLYAISHFTIIKRTKEIGIRKVNGAKVSEIVDMLNRAFLKWVVLAFLISCPIAYFIMNRWLESFAYKTSLSWWLFVLAGTLTLCIAILTVSWQGRRAAVRNPVEVLRNE